MASMLVFIHSKNVYHLLNSPYCIFSFLCSTALQKKWEHHTEKRETMGSNNMYDIDMTSHREDTCIDRFSWHMEIVLL
jgi:hypothetical protein